MASVSFADLKAAVKATIQDISSVGKIETRVGGIPTWVEQQGPYKAFWEIGVLSVAESIYGATVSVYEDFTIQLEGVMPWKYDENTEAKWDALLRLVRDALRENPNLMVNGTPTISGGWGGQGFGLPQLVANNLAKFSDGVKEPTCHHAVIQVRYRNDFDYEQE